MRNLENPIRPYAWGSLTAIPTLLGHPPSDQPQAELWMGAHPSAPSVLRATGQPLTEVIEADPAAELGEGVLRRFGPRLPYLMKILAADQPLSLQVHPDAEQARRGYAAQNGAGLAPDAHERVYIDAHHKPELLVALDPFEALCGFRDPLVSAKVIESLGVPALAPVVRALTGDRADRALRHAVTMLVNWPGGDRAHLIGQVVAAARLGSGADLVTDGDLVADDDPVVLGRRLVLDLAERYPTDVGVVLALLLHHLRLQPDEAVFMPAGNLHAYLRGTGVEIMAASDNVVRGGLTPKYVDVAELLRILRYEVFARPMVAAEMVGPGLRGWPVPVSEFRLTKVDVQADDGLLIVAADGPRIVICVSGAGELWSGGNGQPLNRGDAVWIGADEPALAVSGDLVAFVAAVAH